MTIPSNDAGTLPWRSERGFGVWRYGIGHSQLLLRSPGDGREPAYGIHFEGVELMKLQRSYPLLTLRLATEAETVVFAEVDMVPKPLLQVVLESPGKTGLVACSRLTVRRSDSADDGEWAAGEPVLHVLASGGR
ncbi:hypothetical protein [Paractinoplanes maris]|uniref:hypothetical protein n=1 Tax=Paractinoplanes maris TaxID=1734446 RepID=UPI00202146AC|nr:hypothetical protein [Actinoplanes maris]